MYIHIYIYICIYFNVIISNNRIRTKSDDYCLPLTIISNRNRLPFRLRRLPARTNIIDNSRARTERGRARFRDANANTKHTSNDSNDSSSNNTSSHNK